MSKFPFQVAVTLVDGSLRAIPGTYATWESAAAQARQFLGAVVVSRSGTLVTESKAP